jgi:galactokinase
MTIAVAPGRVNLMGDHTDYVGGLALPCAIDLRITAEFERGGDEVNLTSDATSPTDPMWLRLVHAVASRVSPTMGVRGRLTTTLPIGSGLSSSAACTIAVALALGFEGADRDLVLLAQAAEQEATGVPCGTLDQLAIVHGKAGHACVVDAGALTATRVAVPDGVDIVVVSSGSHRLLHETPYAERRAEAEQAMEQLGGVGTATLADAQSLPTGALRRRARHVLSENARVRAMAGAFTSGDVEGAGALMRESHASLRDDAQVSTHDLDSLVDALSTRVGVFGARLTGAGFGGSAVALVDRDRAAQLADVFGGRVVRPSDGARVTSAD